MKIILEVREPNDKWKIEEVEGVQMPQSATLSRYMELNSNGKMYFYTNDKKEGEGKKKREKLGGRG